MLRKFQLVTISMICMVLMASGGFARDYIIYSIAQDLPMGEENEIIKKNFYVNIGTKQGVEAGTILDVHRSILRINNYDSDKQYIYRVKIGELKVLHTQENASITRLHKVEEGEDTPVFDLDKLMIGDKVNVKVK